MKLGISRDSIKVTVGKRPVSPEMSQQHITGELGYDGPLYDGFLHMTDDVLGPSPMHIKYLSYVYDRFCI